VKENLAELGSFRFRESIPKKARWALLKKNQHDVEREELPETHVFIRRGAFMLILKNWWARFGQR
jgi:hypothetical protein